MVVETNFTPACVCVSRQLLRCVSVSGASATLTTFRASPTSWNTVSFLLSIIQVQHKHLFDVTSSVPPVGQPKQYDLCGATREVLTRLTLWMFCWSVWLSGSCESWTEIRLPHLGLLGQNFTQMCRSGEVLIQLCNHHSSVLVEVHPVHMLDMF